jgi:hypothetical protein
MADRSDTASALPVDCQKSEEIAIGDAHHTVEPVRCERTGGDPAANGAGRDVESLGDLPDRVKAREGLRRPASLKRPRRHQSVFGRPLAGFRPSSPFSWWSLLMAAQCLAAAVDPNVWALAHSSTSVTR